MVARSPFRAREAKGSTTRPEFAGDYRSAETLAPRLENPWIFLESVILRRERRQRHEVAGHARHLFIPAHRPSRRRPPRERSPRSPEGRPPRRGRAARGDAVGVPGAVLPIVRP